MPLKHLPLALKTLTLVFWSLPAVPFCSPNVIIHSINKHLFANFPFFEIVLYKISKYIFLVSPICVQMHVDLL